MVKKDDPDFEFILADDFSGKHETVIRGLLLLAAATFVIAALMLGFAPEL
jgi:hypothetical protein